MPEEKSTHRVEVVRVPALEKHPKADKLSIVKLFGTTPVVVATRDWEGKTHAAFVPPDTLVPLDRPEFAWLRGQRSPKAINGREYHLIRNVKLRGVYSMGLLVPLPTHVTLAGEGQDLAAHFECVHYEPPQRSSGTSKATTFGSQGERKPTVDPPVYGVDNLRRYAEVFEPGEPVYITEKIHGANARYTAEDRGLFSFSRGRSSVALRVGSHTLSWARGQGFKYARLAEHARYMRVGSRTVWKKPDPTDIWWRALEGAPSVAKFCKNYPGWTVYGEVYGDVQDLDYGLAAGQVRFVAFDIMTPEKQFIDSGHFTTLAKRYGMPTVPVMHASVPFDIDMVLGLAEGSSILCEDNQITDAGPAGKPHVREGIVVKPVKERLDPRVGRVALKVVGQGYYDRA